MPLLLTVRLFYRMCPRVHSALTKLIVGLLHSSDDDEYDEYDEYDDHDKDKAAVIAIERSMTVADFSTKVLGAADAILIAAFLPKCQ